MKLRARLHVVASTFAVLATAACAGDTKPAPDTSSDVTGNDTAPDDAAPSADTSTPPDDVITTPDGTTTSDIVRPVDIVPADDTSPTDDVTDTATDIADDTTKPVDPGFVPDPACEYIDMVRFVVKCGGIWTYGGEFMHFGEPNEACIPYVGIGQGAYLTLEEAIAGQNCDGSCVNVATRSVSAVYCRADCATLQRYGWIEFQADNCPTLYELPGGLFLSVADWFAGRTDVCASGNTACLAVPEEPEIPAER